MLAAKPPMNVTDARYLKLYALKVAFDKLVKRAARQGFRVIADSDAIALRIAYADDVKGRVDLRTLGEKVDVHDACGGGGSAVGAGSTSFGVR